jgi:predicted nucleic acid-binding protein
VTPPTVLVDASFLAALTEPDHEWRAVARDLYASLVDSYERHEIRIRARGDHLQPYDSLRKTLLAPVERISVATQYRRAGAELERTLGVAPDAAITLVMMKRERIRRIATFDPTFSAFDDVDVVRRDTPTADPEPDAEG